MMTSNLTRWTALASIILLSGSVTRGMAQDASAKAEKKTDYDGPAIKSDNADAEKELAAQLKLINEQLETLRKEVAALQADRRVVETLEKKVNTLETDIGTFANNLHKMQMDVGSGSLDSLLGTMNTDLTARREFQKALYVNAAVRFYNWEGRAVKINVNGTWHALKKGENNILVAYGPVTIHRWDQGPARIFTDWKAYKNGFVMEFDVGLEANAQK